MVHARIWAKVAAFAGVLVVGQLLGSLFVKAAPDELAQGKQQLAVYSQINQRVAACMHKQGFSYDGGLVKSDVVDAFQATSSAKGLSPRARREVAALTRSTAADPNNAIVATMTVSQQYIWTRAVNQCSSKVDDQVSGSDEQKARLAELQQSAKGSPEVRAAARSYATCMSSHHFSVPSDPFTPPAAIIAAEQDNSANATATLSAYDVAWHKCVEPYQKAYNHKMFG